MIPVKQAAIGHKVQPNHDPKLGPLRLPGDYKPSLLDTQTPAFSRFPVNHCTPYTYTTYPVNHCTPYTYIFYVCIPDRATKPHQRPPFPNHHPNPRNALNPSPASLRVFRPSTPTLNFTPSHLATITPHRSTPDLNQNLQHPRKGSRSHSSKPPVHLEFR
jgi:hypothetical protein